MNEKEAREQAVSHENLDCSCECSDLSPRCYRAIGYLECLEKAKVLEDYVRSQITSVAGHLATNHREGQRCLLCKPREVLAKWEKEK